MWNAGCGARDNNYIMTPPLKMLRKLLRMGLLPSRVRLEAKNADSDSQRSVSN
jgi:hypothetical protein